MILKARTVSVAGGHSVISAFPGDMRLPRRFRNLPFTNGRQSVSTNGIQWVGDEIYPDGGTNRKAAHGALLPLWTGRLSPLDPGEQGAFGGSSEAVNNKGLYI